MAEGSMPPQNKKSLAGQSTDDTNGVTMAEGSLPPQNRRIALYAGGGGFGGALLAIIVARLLEGPCCCGPQSVVDAEPLPAAPETRLARAR